MVRCTSSLELELSLSGSSSQSESQTKQAPANSFRGLPLQPSPTLRNTPFQDGALLLDSLPVKASSSMKSSNESAYCKKYPGIPWLTQSWLAKDNRYERIATASARLGVGLISQGLLEHHINLLPGRKSPADFISVRDEDGGHIGYRAKVRTWPLLKRETLEVREIAA
ncbi:unnamed protein product [Discula destructiva]